jgi:hypothetical protein
MKLTVPVKPEVRDFYFKNPEKFNLTRDLIIRKNHVFGVWICTIFGQVPPKHPEDIEFAPKDLGIEGYKDCTPEYHLEFELKFKVPSQFITDNRLLTLGRILELNMEMYALAWMRGRIDYLPSENSAATSFHKVHKINDGHIKPDAFRQQLRRYGK